MEHQISLSIRVQENSRQSYTELDSRIGRYDGDIIDSMPSPNYTASPSYLPSVFPKEPVLARTSSKYVCSSTDPRPTQRPPSTCSPIIRPIVENSPHGQRPQSFLEHATATHVPTQPLATDPILDAFHLTTSPRWTPAPRTKLLFWWGFLCPPLWFYGSLHLLPSVRRRIPRKNHASNSARRPRRGRILSYLSQLRGPYSKGDLEVGTTTVVVVPRPKTLYDDSCETVMVSDWSPGCISSAERLDAAGINASEWLQPDARTEEGMAELDKAERRGAYHCLLAFLLLSIIVVVSAIISQKVHWPAHLSTHLTSPENEPSMGNSNLIGASSHSSPL